MQRTFLVGIGGVILGMAIGFFGANALNRNDQAQSGAVPGPFTGASLPGSTGGSGALSGQMPDVAATLAAAENQPQDFVAQMKAGQMYAAIGNFQQAIEFYKIGLALRPDDPQGNLVIANAYFDSGQFELAGDHYAKVLARDPGNIAARTDLATTWVERSQPDLDKAIAEFRAVLETEPNHEPTLYNLAIAQFRKGDKEAALNTLSDLEAAHPQSQLIAKLRQNIEAN